jgi:hypothetical protein
VLTRSVSWTPAYDKRHTKPEKNYGIGSLEIWWHVSGPEGTIQFHLMTGIHLSEVREELKKDLGIFEIVTRPLPASLGYHSRTPMYEDHHVLKKECELLEGDPCYYDSRFGAAQAAYEYFISHTEEEFWQYLEDYYRKVFGDVVV